MAGKASMLLALLAVVAFAVPASAGAAPAITEPAGVLVKTGALLEVSSTNAVVETSLGKLSCAKVTGTGQITANTGSTIGAVGVGEGTSTTCFLGGSKPITKTDFTLKKLHSETSGIGTASASFTADLPAGLVCHFETPTTPISFTSGGDVVKLVKADLIGTPAACEPALLSGEFTVQTDGGGAPVIID